MPRQTAGAKSPHREERALLAGDFDAPVHQKPTPSTTAPSATMAPRDGPRVVYASGERSEMIEAEQRNIGPVGVNWKLRKFR